MTKRVNTLTPKQAKIIKAISENVGKGSGKSLRQMAEESGYTPTMARNPHQILKAKAVQNRLASFINTLEEASRGHLLELLKPEKMAGANGRDNAYILDILVKNKRLLSGESTNNQAIAITISESLAERHAENEQKPA